MAAGTATEATRIRQRDDAAIARDPGTEGGIGLFGIRVWNRHSNCAVPKRRGALTGSMSHPLRSVMSMEEFDTPRLSPRLRNALVADLIQDADPAEGDRLILAKWDEHEATDHLARQLGFRVLCDGDLHDTLAVLLPEIDRLLRQWPLPKDGKACSALVKVATKSLAPIEVYAALLSGPSTWRRQTLRADCTVSGLEKQLLMILQRGLSSRLNEMFGRWDAWDVRQLRDRWEEAKKRRASEELATERLQHREEAEARKQRLASSRMERARWNRAASFTGRSGIPDRFNPSARP